MLTMAIPDVEIFAVRLFTVFLTFYQMAPASMVQQLGSFRVFYFI